MAVSNSFGRVVSPEGRLIVLIKPVIVVQTLTDSACAIAASYAAKALTKLAFDLRPARGEASPAARQLYDSFTAPVFLGDYERLLEAADGMGLPVAMLTLPSLLGSPDWSREAARLHFPYYTNSVEMLIPVDLATFP